MGGGGRRLTPHGPTPLNPHVDTLFTCRSDLSRKKRKRKRGKASPQYRLLSSYICYTRNTIPGGSLNLFRFHLDYILNVSPWQIRSCVHVCMCVYVCGRARVQTDNARVYIIHDIVLVVVVFIFIFILDTNIGIPVSTCGMIWWGCRIWPYTLVYKK